MMAPMDARVVPVVLTILLGLAIVPFVTSQGLASKRCESLNSSVAICTEKFLISAQLDGLPLGLRVLNLDRNQINVLENNVFWKTSLLQEISIAQNRLETIYLDAFNNLISLKKLNLSYNRLESMNEFLFDNINIEVLDLSGNNFMYMDGKAFVRSTSLKELLMKNCKLISLSGMLTNIPNLERVDLSNNLLVSLDIPSFAPLTELKYVNLENNFFKCDKPTQYLMEWFRKNSINYEGPFCAIQRNDPKMFQRMELSLDKINEKDIAENDLLRNTSLARINATQVETELVMSLFNKTYFKRCLLMEHEFVCHLLENCKNSLNCEKYLEEQQKHNRLNFYFVLAIFIIGVFIGCIFALCCCQALIYCRVDKERRRRRREYVRREEAYQGVQLRPVNEAGRRQNQTDATANNRDTQSTTVDSNRLAVVESNGFHEFVNELFSRRRSRRQMISAIGQQGTNLVRQLSRSSMNLLRRSQSRANNANIRNAAREQSQQAHSPSTPVYESLSFDPPSQLNVPPFRERSSSFTYSPEMINANNDYLIEDLMRQQRRSESPPPTYDYCVRLPKSGNQSD